MNPISLIQSENTPQTRLWSTNPKPRVGFSGVAASAVMKQATKGLNPLAKGAVTFLKMKEGAGGNAFMQLVQDTAILWAPKALISRSKIELFEISVLELIESFCFYYVPFIAGSLLKKPFQKAAQLAFRPTVREITSPLPMASGKLLPARLGKIAPSKLGLAVSAVAIATAMEYGLNFAKNILTEKGFRQNDFSSIIGLTQNKVENTGEESEVTRKAKRRMIQSTVVAAGITIAALAFTHASSNFSQQTLNKIARYANWFDFDYKKVVDKATGKVTRSFDLGRNQLQVLMPFAILSYWDAARDKLERIEAGCRATITGCYIAYIQPLAAKWFNKVYGKQFANLNIMTGHRGDRVKTLDVIQQETIQEAEKLLAKNGIKASQASIIKKAAELLKPKLRAKNQLFFIPFLFGILVVGLFTALMNQIWTKYRFRKTMRDVIENNASKQAG